MIPGTVAHQAPLSMEFSRKEDWSGLPFLSPGDLLNLGTEPESPALAGWFFMAEPPGKPVNSCAVTPNSSVMKTHICRKPWQTKTGAGRRGSLKRARTAFPGGQGVSFPISDSGQAKMGHRGHDSGPVERHVTSLSLASHRWTP